MKTNSVPTAIIEKQVTKTVKELRTILETKMEQTPQNGSWINPFRDDAYNKDIEPIVHTYRSQAVDEALKFFLSKYLGENRRLKFLGEDWKEIA